MGGNRPRIMDVCIPKVAKDGSVSNEWKNLCENADGEYWDDRSMLNKMKILQRMDQSLENENNNNNNDNEGGGNNNNNHNNNNDGEENPEDANNNRPDFGLLSLQNR